MLFRSQRSGQCKNGAACGLYEQALRQKLQYIKDTHAAFPGVLPPLLTGWLPLEGLWVLLAAGLAAYAVSLLVSIRIYERQDH